MQAIKKIDYDTKIDLKPLKSCAQILDPLDDYILSDYFIASSYNTHLIG